MRGESSHICLFDNVTWWPGRICSEERRGVAISGHTTGEACVGIPGILHNEPVLECEGCCPWRLSAVCDERRCR